MAAWGPLSGHRTPPVGETITNVRLLTEPQSAGTRFRRCFYRHLMPVVIRGTEMGDQCRIESR
jgi:hypothetical protein